jgi:hypothetical protein
LALGRGPTPGELKSVREFLATVPRGNEEAQQEAWSQIFHALFGSIDFRYVD